MGKLTRYPLLFGWGYSHILIKHYKSPIRIRITLHQTGSSVGGINRYKAYEYYTGQTYGWILKDLEVDKSNK